MTVEEDWNSNAWPVAITSPSTTALALNMQRDPSSLMSSVSIRPLGYSLRNAWMRCATSMYGLPLMLVRFKEALTSSRLMQSP